MDDIENELVVNVQKFVPTKSQEFKWMFSNLLHYSFKSGVLSNGDQISDNSYSSTHVQGAIKYITHRKGQLFSQSTIHRLSCLHDLFKTRCDYFNYLSMVLNPTHIGLLIFDKFRLCATRHENRNKNGKLKGLPSFLDAFFIDEIMCVRCMINIALNKAPLSLLFETSFIRCTFRSIYGIASMVSMLYYPPFYKSLAKNEDGFRLLFFMFLKLITWARADQTTCNECQYEQNVNKSKTPHSDLACTANLCVKHKRKWTQTRKNRNNRTFFNNKHHTSEARIGNHDIQSDNIQPIPSDIMYCLINVTCALIKILKYIKPDKLTLFTKLLPIVDGFSYSSDSSTVDPRAFAQLFQFDLV